MAVDFNVIDTAGLAYRLNATQKTGLISLQGDINDLIDFNISDDTALDILGGTAQVMDNSILGKSTLSQIAWDTQTIPSGQTTGNFVIAVDLTGAVITIDNQGASTLTSTQVASGLLQLGNFTAVSSVVTQVFIAPQQATSDAISMFSLFSALGPFNFSGAEGFNILNFGTLDLTMQISAGSSISFDAAAIDNIAAPDVVTRPERSPATLVAHADPVTGAFSFSPTAEADPTLVSKKGTIAAFADAGGGQVVVTSNQHGMNSGDFATITDTTNYNGGFTISVVTGNTFQITATFVVDDATGNWTGLSLVANNLFTGQRVFLFPQSGIIGMLYGLEEYSTIAAYDSAAGEFSEGFIAPPIVDDAIRVSTLVIRQNITAFLDPMLFQFRKSQTRIKL